MVVGVLDEVGWAEEDAMAEAHDEDMVAVVVLVEEPIHFFALRPISCGGHDQQVSLPSFHYHCYFSNEHYFFEQRLEA